MPEPVQLPDQHPSNVRDYRLGFANQLATGEEVASITSVTVDTGLTLHDGGVKPAPAIDAGTGIVVWLSGGTAGVTYTGTVVAVSTGGRTLVGEFAIRISTAAQPD